jgi:hypothetical protein
MTVYQQKEVKASRVEILYDFKVRGRNDLIEYKYIA